MKKRRILLAVIFLVAAGSACDPVYRPVLCNGYDKPVMVTAVFQQGARKAVADLPPGECKSEIVMQTNLQVDLPMASSAGQSANEITVTSSSGGILAVYSEEANKNILPGLSFTPHWLLTGSGLFEVPREYEENWHKNIIVIEKSAHRSFPNLQKRE